MLAAASVKQRFWRRFARGDGRGDARGWRHARQPRPPAVISPIPRIDHVVWLEFDNVHLRRDNPNVPSDIEQMPDLHATLSAQNGIAALQRSHDPDLAHRGWAASSTATGSTRSSNGSTSRTPTRSFNGSSNSTDFQQAFTYWTDPTEDGLPNLITDGQKNTPAPWVPFTRAGCDVGAFSLADIELENLI